MVLLIQVVIFLINSCEDRICDGQWSCRGHFVDSKVVSTLQECARSCGDFDDCNYYTFEEKYGHCVMFEDCDSYDKSCETCKSGERKCLVQLGKDGVVEN